MYRQRSTKGRGTRRCRASGRETLLSRARRNLERGRVDDALAAYQVLLAEYPDDLYLANRAGDLMAESGAIEDAVALFMQIAGAWDTHGFVPQATAVYRKVLRHDPLRVEAWERLAALYRRRGLYREATRYASRVAD